ncbi:hypothetical protein XBO1_2420004 [Xenorhabdus bovienii str. oregonense]|uniref:Uncharacterized protein n=1 Tax=Xenorhabdus bovienii str. oregonense TaxID=1398202 RepID=A0A077P6M2_XENBV|nr:hypothetical protein XBO1_2420004 [Xenorhabdus bovienii str. oregonense]
MTMKVIRVIEHQLITHIGQFPATLTVTILPCTIFTHALIHAR